MLNKSDIDKEFSDLVVFDQNGKKIAPLSYGQKRLNFIYKLKPDNSAYNISRVLKLKGNLNIEVLTKSLNEIVRRHDSLRTSFRENNGEDVQVVRSFSEFQIPFQDFSSLPNDQIESIVDHAIDEERNTIFILAEGGLFRFKLYKIHQDDFLFIITFHHIITDGWSMRILYNELSTLYNAYLSGKGSPLEEISFQYTDFAKLQKQNLGNKKQKLQLEYWKQKLKDFPELHQLPTDFLRPNEQVFEGERVSFEVEKHIVENIKNVCEETGTTLNMILMTAYAVLLSRYSNASDIIIGSPMANRNQLEVEPLIGFFVNTIPLRILIPENITFNGLLLKVKATVFEAFGNQDATFDQIVEELQPSRNLSHSPIVQLIFAYHNLPDINLNLSGLSVEFVPIAEISTDNDLEIHLNQNPKGVSGYFVYNKALFHKVRIERMAEHFINILKNLSSVNQKVCDINFLTEEEKHYILSDLNSNIVDYPKGKNVCELFEEQVSKFPNKDAVVYENKKISYKELNDRANRLSLTLKGMGVEANSIVSVYLERSLDLVVGLIGIIKAGGAYLPIDANTPIERVNSILTDSKAKCLLVSNETSKIEFASVEKIIIDQKENPLTTAENPALVNTVDDLFYIIYTSGTTGTPKGVPIKYSGFLNLLSNYSRIFKTDSDSRLSQISSISFDALCLEVWPCLTCGASLYIIDEITKFSTIKIKEFIIQNCITHSFLPTVYAEELIAEDWPSNISLRHLLTGGDRLKKFSKSTHPFKFYNLYGPTEDTVWTTYTEVKEKQDNENSQFPSIGRAIVNKRLYILDPQQNLQPLGVPGELCISGIGLSGEYLNNEELSRKKYVNNPFEKGEILYKTGDLGRWLPNGEVEILGRIDNQVKVNGFRIELEEIEHALTKISGVKQSCVVVKERKIDTGSNKYLAAYYVLDNSDNALSQAVILEKLAQMLPEYMVPSALMQMESFPLTTNEKLDKRALPEPDFNLFAEKYIAPTTEKEKAICKIWQEALGLERVGVTDNFFRIGGNSILVIQTSHQMSKVLGYDVKVADVFKYKTISQILNSNVRQTRVNIPQTGTKRSILSFAQERLWFIEQYEQGTNAFHIPVAYELDVNTNIEGIKYSLQQIVVRHEVLRSTIEMSDNQDYGMQVVHDMPLVIDEVKLTSDEDYEVFFREDINRPFDLRTEYPIRVKFFNIQSTSQPRIILLVIFHHIASDGWSIDIFQKELFAYYEQYTNKDADFCLPVLDMQYKDYAIWQRAYLTGDILEKQLSYWKSKLSGYQNLELPTDYVRPSKIDYSGSVERFTLSEDISQKLRTLAKQFGVTLHSVMLSSINILLSKYSGQDDIVVGSSIANRHHRQTEGLIGFFVNTQAHRTLLNSTQSFKDLIQQVYQDQIEAQLHQDLPIEKLIAELGIERDTSRNNIFQVLFVVQSFGKQLNASELQKNYLKPLKIKNAYEVEKFDLSIYIDDSIEELTGYIGYATALFRKDTIVRLIKHYENLLTQLVKTPELPYNQISLISPEEYYQIIHQWNDNDADYPKDKTIHQLFQEQAEKTPDNIAIVYEQQRLTYKELNEKSNQLARYIRAQYLQKTQKALEADTLIALCLDRSLEVLVGILGVLKAGGAYVPMDPEYPQDRIDYILENTEAEFVLSQKHLKENVCGKLSPEKVIYIGLTEKLYKEEDVSNLQQFNSSKNLAYVIYTSGTTGRPKGVLIKHQPVINLITFHNKRYSKLSKNLLVALISNYNFDFSVQQIFNTILYGHTLYVVSKDLILNPLQFNNFLKVNKIEVFEITPTLFSQLILPFNNYQDFQLKLINIGGENLPASTVSEFLRKKIPPQISIINTYGPTEYTVDATSFEIDCSAKTLGSQKSILIGKPLDNTKVYVLDAGLNPVPIGVIGELHIGGAGLAEGYLKRPDLTVERFIPNPFATELDKAKGYDRLYKTGDLVHWLPDGNLDFMGRNDDQVKIRGYRIELGEIERALLDISGIKQSCVLVKERKTGSSSNKYLIAYYVLTNSDEKLTQTAILDKLSQVLTEYMMPSALVEMDSFPLTVSGKIDKRALPDPDFSLSVDEYVEPTTETEKELCKIWQDVLGLDRVGVTDDFFRVGGNSILAIQLSHRMSRTLGCDIKVADMFRYKTISQLLPHALEGYAQIKVPKIDSNQAIVSFAQERLWFIEQYEGGTNAYHIPAVFELNCTTDVEGVKYALRQIVARHEVLRSTIEQKDNQEHGIQIVHDSPLPIAEALLTNKDDYEPLIKEEINRPFNLSSEYPIRVKFFHIQSDELTFETSLTRTLFLINIHHIAGDGWSMDIFLRELFAYYEAYIKKDFDFRLPALEIQYKDYAVWQRNYLTNKTLEEQISYWKLKLSGYQTLELPVDYVRPNLIDYRGANQVITLDKEVSQQLKKLAQRHGTTLHSVMLSSVSILLSKYTGQDDIIIGSPMANRHHRQTEGLIGFFVNTQANRILLNHAQSYEDLIQQVHQDQVEAQRYQDLPFEKLVEELGVARDLSRHPIFQVMFSVQSFGTHGKAQEQQKNYFKLLQTESAYNVEKFDLSIFINDSKEELTVFISYATSLFRQDTIERLIRHYQRLLVRLAGTPEQPYGSISLLSPEEEYQITREWNRPDHEYPNGKTIPQLFSEQVAQTPESIALVYGQQQLTYRQLDERSNQLARHIRARYQQRTGKPFAPSTLIALSMERSLEMIVGILGVLKAGGAYVPMDPGYPQERADYILGDTGVEFVVSQRTAAQRAELPSERVVYVDLTEPFYHEEDASSLPMYSQTPDLAYIIYTSGSTGNPKGVRITHRNFCPLMHWGYEVMRLSSNDRILQNLSYYFDWSVWEIFIALTSGASLYMVSKELLLDPVRVYGFVESNQITVIHGTPSWFSSILQTGKRLDSLRMLIPGAEKLGVDTVLRYIEHVSSECRIFNMYGPTEATIMSAVHEIDRNKLTYYQTLGSIPIGKPISNLSLAVLDRNMNLCPVGVPGELYISGDGVSMGYLNDEEKTRRVFIPNPLPELQGDTLYKTGDLVRWLPNGSIEFFGRNDEQVKIRGFRIELGEIENALTQIPGVAQGCILVKERKTEAGSNKYLVAYYVPENAPSQTAIMGELARVLPEYMIPSALVCMDSFPMNLNGKLDRWALPEPDLSTPAEAYVAPGTESEVELCRIWGEILGQERVGVTDEFFSIGGNSILAIQASHRMSRALGYDLKVADIFKYKTISQLLTHSLGQTSTIIPRVASNPAALSFAQERLWFIEQYEGGSSAYHIPVVLELDPNTDVDGLKHALWRIVERHEVLRSTIEQPENQKYGVQVVHDEPLLIEELSIPAGGDYQSIIREDIHRPFILNREYPIRVRFYTIQPSKVAPGNSQGKTLLLVNMHHIASDGWSMGIFLRELHTYYDAYIRNDEIFRLPVLEIQYRDFAVWQKSYLTGEILAKQLDYWQSKLSGFQNLELPTDHVRPSETDYRGASRIFRLGEEISQQLRVLAQCHGATLHSVMLSSISILLGKYTSQNDIVIGSPTANRHHRQTEDLIGFFVNTQANRILLGSTQSYSALIRQVQQDQVEAQRYQDLPFEKLVEELGVTRDLSRHPVFQVMFSVQNFGNQNKTQTQRKSLFKPSTAAGVYNVEKFDLTIFIDDSQAELTGQISYATSLFRQDTIDRFIGHYQRLLTRLVEESGLAYSQIGLLGQEERWQILQQWNRPGKYPNDRTIPQLFREQVERTPERIALTYEGHQLTYMQLNERSNQLARHIRIQYQKLTGCEFAPSTLIALSLERGLELVVGILAVLKAGGAYVPMDPYYPQERVDYILDDTRVELVLCQRQQTQTGRAQLPEDKVVLVDLDENLYMREDTADLPSYSEASDLAYIIYTSGSTGIPKGVRITHRNLCPLLHWGYDVMGLKPEDRVLQNLSYYFDWSVWEIFIALTSGSSLYMVPKELLLDSVRVYAFIESNRITVIHGTPSWFSSILQGEAKLNTLRMLIPGAEKLTAEMVQRYLGHVNPGCRVFNMYGPTEATIMAAVHEVDRGNLSYYRTLQSIPIGVPIANNSLLVLDRDMNPCPVHVPGELYICGDGVSEGYLNDEAKIRKLFLPNPFEELGGDTLYKTGDLVRWLPDGSIEFFGRNDEQVKIRGFRIELGEIENALTQIPGVAQGCILVKERKTEAGSNQYLVAYYVPENVPSQASILGELARVLPEYMVPSALVRMDSFPMNLNGKLDRRALPDPDFSATEEAYVAPDTENEAELCQIWGEVLGLE
ncbi:MAG: amino acid adenylation domain-containing protein, partial [Bacteroidales bacterium]|nr:amino acid adenylation domain-containing protein [Bacteroidales bacterium]